MKKLLTILFLTFVFNSVGQTTDKPDSIWSIRNNYGISLFTPPSYPEKDTLKCLFLEVLNMDSATVKWTSGYIVRNSGMISFGNTSVSGNYLPITDGIITSPLFYSDMCEVKNSAIKVIIKPTK